MIKNTNFLISESFIHAQTMDARVYAQTLSNSVTYVYFNMKIVHTQNTLTLSMNRSCSVNIIMW